MPAPLAKGIIIAASVIVAVGYALYESPEVRRWVDQSRRKIAIALHQLGNDIQPRRPSESSEDFEARRREVIRRQRNELIRRAREEGIAVDLDELARVGSEDVEMSERNGLGRSIPNPGQSSFDHLVANDGRLKGELTTAEVATGSTILDANVRRRGIAGSAAGSAAAADPFSDGNLILFDRDTEACESSATIEDKPASSEPAPATKDLRDLPSTSAPQCPKDVDAEWFAALPLELQQEIAAAHAPEDHSDTASTHHISAPDSESGDQAAQSFYSFTSSNEPLREPLESTAFFQTAHFPSVQSYGVDDDIAGSSAGTLTPRSSRSGHSIMTGASVGGSQADDVAVLDTDMDAMSLQNDTDHDACSEAWSEGGFTTDAESGVMTPSGSWTDVGSDDEGSAVGGHGNNHGQHQA